MILPSMIANPHPCLSASVRAFLPALSAFLQNCHIPPVDPVRVVFNAAAMPSRKATIHQPHDKLVKSTFSDSDNARAFLKANIPHKLARRIDWNSLTLVSGSFIDPEFAATSSDLLFTAKIDGLPAFLYILFEHQNQEDPLIGLRLLTYMVRIWNDYLRNNPGATELPLILPLVLAQDNKPWKTSTRFADFIDIPEGAGEEMKKHIPDFEFQLVELFRMPFEKILGTPMGILTLRALKAEKLQALLDDTVWDESLLIQLPPSSFEMLMRYILDRDLDKPAFRRRLKTLRNPKLSKNAMSLAEQYRQEGIRKGRQQGRQEGHQEGRQEGHQEGLIFSKQQDILEALEIRFQRVPEGLREEIESIIDTKKLTQLHRAAITSADLESFAAEL
jgi:predicted transposase/invertase (TIGR01784 family)